MPNLSRVVVPIGGGGLAAGVAIAVKSQRPNVRVIGVEASVCAPYAGGATPAGPVVTLADGIAVKHPGELTAPLIAEWVDEIVTVDEDAIADAMVLLMDRAKLYVEGADKEALAYLHGKAAEDTTAADTSMAAAVLRSPTPVNWNMGTLVGSYANVARMMDEIATMPGVKGIMLTFDDFLEGLDTFGERIQPLMECRKDRLPLAAE